MTRFFAVALLVAASALMSPGAVAQQPSPEPQQPVFRGTSDAVRVFVTVTDKEGRLVTTLAKDDFQLRDEGKPQPITQFDNTPQPIRLIVMLDVSGSMEGNLPILRAGTAQLFTRLLQDDGVRVGTFGKEINISTEFTRDPQSLRSTLPNEIDPEAPTPLWRGIDEALNALAGVKEGTKDGTKEAVRERADAGRAVILVLSDGKDSGPISFRARPVSQAEVIDRARRDDVMIYGVGMRSRSSRPMMPGIGPGGLQAALMADMPDPGLARVAEETGGGYVEIRAGQDLGAAFAKVADELHGQYLLGFAPPKRDGKVHDIDVRVTTQGGLKPRARDSYVAPKG